MSEYVYYSRKNDSFYIILGKRKSVWTYAGLERVERLIYIGSF